MMDEAHASRYLVHSRANKMYYDLRDMYGSHTFGFIVTTRDTRVEVGYNNYGLYYKVAKIKAEIGESSLVGFELVQETIDKVDLIKEKLKETGDHQKSYKYLADTNLHVHLEEIKVDKTLCFVEEPVEIIDRENDGKSERTIQTLEDMLRTVRCAPFKALYGRKYRSPIMWAKVGEGQLIGPELVQETSEKILQIKDRLKAVSDHQKSYADKRRIPLEFSVDLPEELNGVHDTFHVSNHKKCLTDPTMQVPLDDIQVDAKLNFKEEPLESLDRKFKKLKRSGIANIKNLVLPSKVTAVGLVLLKEELMLLSQVNTANVILMLSRQIILNGDSHVPTRVVEGILQPVAPTTAEQRLARKNELKARGTLLMALPDKHQLKFNSYKNPKILMEAIKKRFGRNTKTKKVQKTLLKQQFENFTGSSSEDIASQNLAFVSSSHTNSTTNSVSAAASVSAACAKLPVTPPPNIDVDDLEEMDLRWQMAMLTMRARRKGYFSRECRSPKDPRRPEEEPSNFALMAFSSNSSSDNEVPTKWWYHAVPPSYIRTFMPPKPDLVFNIAPTAVETDNLAFNVQLSPTKPKQDLSHTTRPSAPIIEDWVDSEHSNQPIETTILAATPVPVSPKSNSSGKRRNRKAYFVCKNVDHLIKDCDFHTKKMAQPAPRTYSYKSKPVSNTAVRPVSAALPSITVTRPIYAHHVVTKSKLTIRRHTTRSPTSKTSTSPLRVTAVKALVVSAAQGKQGTWVWRPKCHILDHGFQTTSASMTLKWFDYNDALGRSKSVMAWVPKRI
nr:hypothetical protein [Tanacetum cinerariifolium]